MDEDTWLNPAKEGDVEQMLDHLRIHGGSPRKMRLLAAAGRQWRLR